MNGEMISFSDGNEVYEAYFSPSETGKGPGIIVIQEWWGLVGHIKDVADRFAKAGFTALAPDLYGGKTADEPDEAASLMMALHIGHTEAILRKAILTLLARPETEGDKVGVVGFCMGGQLAMFAAGSNPVIGATVNFYGIHPKVEPSHRNINGPILGFFAENDTYANPEAVRALSAELTLLGKPHEFITYPNTGHAFFNDDRPSYDRSASVDAWMRMTAFLNENLRP
jgi:carboxymethylenebutenolidase